MCGLTVTIAYNLKKYPMLFAKGLNPFHFDNISSVSVPFRSSLTSYGLL